MFKVIDINNFLGFLYNGTGMRSLETGPYNRIRSP